MKHDSNPSPVRMIIKLVRPDTAIKSKPVSDEGGNHFTGGQIAKVSIVDTHGSNGHCHARFDGDLSLVARLLRKMFAVLNHAIHNHTYDVMDVLERFGFRRPPG